MDSVVTIKVSKTIENEYADRLPSQLPLKKLKAGTCKLTLEEAQAVLDDAEFNSNTECQDVGPYGMPLNVFNSYKALAKQVQSAINKITIA
jgi:hypothetical protein